MFTLGEFSIGALVALLLGGFVGHVLAIRRGKFQKRHEAAIVFKQALIPALDALRNGESQFDVILRSFDAHHAAALQFSAHLDESDRRRFSDDLRRYSLWRDELYGKSTVEIMYETNSTTYLAAKSMNPSALLNTLLSHART